MKPWDAFFFGHIVTEKRETSMTQAHDSVSGARAPGLTSTTRSHGLASMTPARGLSTTSARGFVSMKHARTLVSLMQAHGFMTHLRGLRLVPLIGIAAMLAACGGGAAPHGQSYETDAGTDAGDVPCTAAGRHSECAVGDTAPPKPVSDHPECILSADCPAGLHCDLGECIQECNTESACSSGKTCSSRARCLGPAEDDKDPPRPSTSAGTLDVSPLLVKLTRANNGKTIDLLVTTNSSEEVRYRVQVDAPYLSIDKARGSFKTQTTLPIKINTNNIVARDIPGTVTIYSTLGTTVVQLPLHTGLTGRYHGSLNYNGDAVPLGETRLDLDVIEEHGDVSVRVAPEHSMLFPAGATSDGAAYGFGSLNSDGSVDLTIEHRFESSAGGTQNHLGRPIGRRLMLHLASTNTGLFDGTFTEAIYGLFQNPVQTKGAAHLEFMPEAGEPTFQTKNVMMPKIDSSTQSLPLSLVDTLSVGPHVCPTGSWTASSILTTCYNPLRTSLANPSTKYSELSESCKLILGLPNTAVSSSTACGCVADAACALATYATGGDYAGKGVDQGVLAQNLVAPAALIAQQEVVATLRDSVANGKGIQSELAHYDTALAALRPVAAWLMQPGLLEFFRNIPATVAEQPPALPALSGTTTVSGTETEKFPIARALARVVQLLVEVNAERQRVAGATLTMDPSAQIAQAQNNSVVAYLEAVALLGILDSWSAAPPSAIGSLTGILTKLDRAFTDMTGGVGDSLGSPKRHVPFVYRPDDAVSGTTNFEQKLTIAAKAVAQLQPLETTFVEDSKLMDQAGYGNATQLTDVKSRFDQQLHEVCGADFNLDLPPTSIDWTQCGAKSGLLAELSLDIETAQINAQAGLERAQGQKDKIDIDVHLVASKKKLRDDQLAFVSEAGQQIVVNTATIGMLSAMQEMLALSSNSNVWNAGASAVMGVASYGLGLEKAGLEADNEQLRQYQTMKVQQTDADIEYAEGMANIKREQIDLREMVIEARQGAIGILESQLKAGNALARAQEIYASRTQTNQLIATDPSMDPAYRLMRNKSSLAVLEGRASAQRQLLEAGRALEYEMNQDLPTLEFAVQSARNHATLNMLQVCLDKLFDQFNEPYGSPQTYSTTVSLRKLFGVTGPRQDEVTGATLSEGEQFRAYVLNNQSLDADGTLRIQFSTNLMPGNGIWATDNCNDKISEVQAQLVGDFLGDNEAQLNLQLSGSALLRACDTSEIRAWSLDTDRTAVIQAGVNTFGDVTNTTLVGQSVARATWTLVIKGGTEVPTNADVDVTKLDDIVLKIKHKALPIQSSSSWALDDSCLGDIVNY